MSGKGAAPRLHVRKDKTNPRRLAYLALLLFAQPPGPALAVAGAALVLAAVAFHGWAAGHLARAGYVEREPELTVRGPYRHNRNPYYVAHLAMDLGFFCLAGLPWLYPLYFPVIFSVYRKWVISEEPFLAREFGDAYARFHANVPRWRVRITPAPAQGPEQRFSFAMFRRNRELSRAGAHVALGCVLGAFAAFGSPLDALPLLARITAFAVIAVWLVLHDVYRVGAPGVSRGWSAAAAGVAVAGAALLAAAPASTWQRFDAPAAWLCAAAGVAFGGLALFGPDAWLARPVVRWYAAALAAGLFSATFGGLHAAVLASLALWMAVVAGVVPLDPGPHGSARRPKERPHPAAVTSA